MNNTVVKTGLGAALIAILAWVIVWFIRREA
jgi:hypothetical protein